MTPDTTIGRSQATPDTMRLFFAFWPDEVTRRAIGERLTGWLDGYPCRPQRPDQWHLTAEFLGDVPKDRWAALHEAAAAVSDGVRRCQATPDTAVRLDRIEHWAKPQVLCLTASQPLPEEVTAFVARLKQELKDRGFTPESRPFKAHLTLARKARQRIPERLVEPILWPIHELTLVRSITDPSGSRYEPLARWNVGHDERPYRPNAAHDGPTRID